MARLGLIAGSSLHDAELPEGDWTAIRRHEVAEGYRLPHLIDHVANLRALAEAGCDRVLALSSVGGLRVELGPGTLVCPDDFIALDVEPLTVLEGAAAHRVPRFDAALRGELREALREAGVDAVEEGVYWQTRGPRLETPAEVRFVAGHADVVGMTVASECVLAGELGLRYAALCVVDNLANGVGGEDLTLSEIERNRDLNRAALRATLDAILPMLA
ncbi:MAG TPA: MTAP family purine nucleoside phosphorylase [Solirubrobacterales bacterium]